MASRARLLTAVVLYELELEREDWWWWTHDAREWWWIQRAGGCRRGGRRWRATSHSNPLRYWWRATFYFKLHKWENVRLNLLPSPLLVQHFTPLTCHHSCHLLVPQSRYHSELMFTPSLLDTIVEQSNVYAQEVMGEERYQLWIKITMEEIKAHLGFCGDGNQLSSSLWWLLEQRSDAALLSCCWEGNKGSVQGDLKVPALCRQLQVTTKGHDPLGLFLTTCRQGLKSSTSLIGR